MIEVGDKVVCPTGSGCGVDIIYALDTIGKVVNKGVHNCGTVWYHVAWDGADDDDFWVHWDGEIELLEGSEYQQFIIECEEFDSYE